MLLGLLFLFGSCLAHQKPYEGHQVIKTEPLTDNHVRALREIYERDSHNLDFWQAPVRERRSVTVAGHSHHLRLFAHSLTNLGIGHDIVVQDLQRLAEHDQAETEYESDATEAQPFNTSRYHRYNEMLEYMKQTSEDNPDLVQLLTIGKSTEGRDIVGLKIGSGSNRSAIWIDGGIHAREWIAPATALYLMEALVSGFRENNTHIRRLVDSADWFIFPCVNPDGYEYSWIKKRYWRKTRSPQHCNQLFCCFGVDANRNFDFHWGEAGSSNDSCSEIFGGSDPFTEPETKAMADFIFKRREQIKIYIALHSYGNVWLVPFGYKVGMRSRDYEELETLAKEASLKMEFFDGANYTVEPSAKLYPASGASDDWAKGVAGIKYSYTLELRPGTNEAAYTFFKVSESKIALSGKEALSGLGHMVSKVMTNEYNQDEDDKLLMI